ncbi:MAG: peptidylprolyl isomerase [Pleomorphochaeta sp.]
MQTKKIIASLACLLISVNTIFAAVPLGKPAAIVKFNGQTFPITETELNTQVESVVAMYKAQGQNLNASDIKIKVLDSMIDNILLEAGAARDGVVISDSQLNQLFLQQKYSIEQQAGRSFSDSEFEQIISQQVGSVDEYKEYLKSQSVINQYLLLKKGNKFTGDSALPTEDEINGYYRANKSSLINPECVNIGQIFVPFSDNDTNNSNETLLKKVAADLKSYKISWNNAVSKYNEDVSNTKSDGDIGWLTQDDDQNIKTVLGLEYFNTAFDLDVGKTSDLIITSQGYHIIKVKQHLDAKFLDLDDPISPADSTTVREYITESLANQKTQILAENALIELSQDLREDATITYLTK